MTHPFILRDELQREIDQEVEEVLARARRKGESLLAETVRQNEAAARTAAEELAQELAAQRRRALQKAEMAGRNSQLRIRREEIEGTLALVRERLLSIEKEQADRFGELLARLFAEARDLLPPGAVRVRTGSAALGERLAGEQGVAVALEPDLHGLVLESGDGRVRCDLSVEALLEALGAEREAELAALLFRDDDERAGG
jgi:vacuolar-type H+-ATPase subunit E/Vma4